MAESSTPGVFRREDGSSVAFDVLGEKDSKAEPIVLVAGLSMVRGDWGRLAQSLSTTRQVLVYDHRGIGDSTFSSTGNETLSIELMARDLLDLLTFLEWKDISLCGFSMGGLVAQQLLFLPYATSNPTPPLPFKVTHLILAGTLTGPKDKEPGFKFSPPAKRPTTKEEAIEFARPIMEAVFDPTWYNDPTNADKVNWWLNRSSGRPFKIIGLQARAIDGAKLEEYYSHLSRDIEVLVIHGKLDRIVPFSYSADILRLIPWAKRVEVGTQPGQIEHMEFGHNWFEYFDISVWCEVINRFVDMDTGVRL